jgi:hypothetical protein
LLPLRNLSVSCQQSRFIPAPGLLARNRHNSRALGGEEEATVKLEFLQITIKPWSFSDTENKLLEINVRANLQHFHLKKVITPDDFESLFDRIMDSAKEELKATIAKYNDERGT